MRNAVLEVHPDAEAEIDTAHAWYQRQSSSAASRFLIEVDATIERVLANPFAGPKAFTKYRKLVVDHFPFCVYYRIDGHTVQVMAIAHDRRKPGYWLKRR